jgi:hypothetical protein
MQKIFWCRTPVWENRRNVEEIQKPYNVSASIREEKHTKYVTLDRSITVSE